MRTPLRASLAFLIGIGLLLSLASSARAWTWPFSKKAPQTQSVIPQPAREPIPSNIGFQIRINSETGAKEIWAASPFTEQRISEIVTVPKGTHYFHWLNLDDYTVISKEGGFGKIMFDIIFRRTFHRLEAQGPGVYVSLSPTDSSGFGPKVLMGTAPRDLQLASTLDIFSATIDGFKLFYDQVGVNERLRQIGIDGRIQSDRATWINFVRSSAVEHMVVPTGDDLLNSILERNQLIESLKQKSPNAVVGAETNPLVGIQTLYQKGYSEQAPNDWTREHIPEWDRLLRGEPLSDADRATIERTSETDLQQLAVLFSKNDPHFMNVAKYFENEANRLSSPELKTKLDGFFKAQQEYNQVISAYQQTDAYKAYQTAMSQYYQSAAFQSYQTATINYNQTPAYQAYQSDLQRYMTSEAYKKYAAALLAYNNQPAVQAYNQAFQQYYQSPGYRQWVQNQIALGQGVSGTPPGVPIAPAGAPTPPTSKPEPPPYPNPPPVPTAPPAPDIQAPDLGSLTVDEQKVYNYRNIAQSIRNGGVENFQPVPVTEPKRTPEQETKFKRRLFLGCLLKALHL